MTTINRRSLITGLAASALAAPLGLGFKPAAAAAMGVLVRFMYHLDDNGVPIQPPYENPSLFFTHQSDEVTYEVGPEYTLPGSVDTYVFFVDRAGWWRVTAPLPDNTSRTIQAWPETDATIAYQTMTEDGEFWIYVDGNVGTEVEIGYGIPRDGYVPQASSQDKLTVSNAGLSIITQWIDWEGQESHWRSQDFIITTSTRNWEVDTRFPDKDAQWLEDGLFAIRTHPGGVYEFHLPDDRPWLSLWFKETNSDVSLGSGDELQTYQFDPEKRYDFQLEFER